MEKIVYVKDDTKKKLEELKKKWGAVSLDEVINMLLVNRI